MRLDRKIILDSLTNNLDKFLVKLTDRECIELSNYLSYNFLKEPPTEIQKEFIEEFFTLDKWLNFYQQCKRKEMGLQIYFFSEPEFWNEIRTHVLFHVSFLYERHLSKQEKEIKDIKIKKEDKLKKDLDNAILDSEFDGVFDKCEGWCNVARVLENHKLINLSKYE